jgi:hypothetical protein
MKKIILIILAIIILVPVIWATWYTYNRQTKIAQAKQCQYEIEHPKPPTIMMAPDGTPAILNSIVNPCMNFIVLPSLSDIITGHIVFEGIPERMKVNPYSFTDVLLGRYTVGPNVSLPCNQSATTTDCSKLPPPQSEPQPYIPPDPTKPEEEWTTATNTPVSFDGFSFTLTPGWHGSVYKKAYAGGWHALVQRDLNKGGFVIDCPPDGKGLEAATRLSTEERSFVVGTTTYSISFEHWTAPGNDPWIFVWLKSNVLGDWNTDQYGNICIAQGSTDPDVEAALKELYESWK